MSIFLKYLPIRVYNYLIFNFLKEAFFFSEKPLFFS